MKPQTGQDMRKGYRSRVMSSCLPPGRFPRCLPVLRLKVCQDQSLTRRIE